MFIIETNKKSHYCFYNYLFSSFKDVPMFARNVRIAFVRNCLFIALRYGTIIEPTLKTFLDPKTTETNFFIRQRRINSSLVSSLCKAHSWTKKNNFAIRCFRETCCEPHSCAYLVKGLSNVHPHSVWQSCWDWWTHLAKEPAAWLFWIKLPY